jgi:hypothetical protein
MIAHPYPYLGLADRIVQPLAKGLILQMVRWRRSTMGFLVLLYHFRKTLSEQFR